MTSSELAVREATNGHVGREWIALLEPAAALANQVAGTGFVPRSMQGNPAAIVAAILYGDELGLGPMQALAKISVIEGKPSLSAEAQRALVLAAGHEIRPTEAGVTKVTMAGKRADTGAEASVTWTLDDAKRANLAGKQNWRMYPRQMLAARATAELCRLLFADVIGGLAATEELEDADDVVVVGTADAATSTPTTKRRRRKASTAVVAEPEADRGEETVSSPELPPLPDEPAEPLVEPTPEPDNQPAGDPEPGEPRPEAPPETPVENPEVSDADQLGFDESDGGTSPPDSGEAGADETTADGSPADSAGASPEKPPTKAQASALNALVGKLRETEVELELGGKRAPIVTTEQLWAAAATRRNVDVDTMIDLLGGRDDAGVLHWAPLRDSLTKSEASDLMTKLVDRARKWGIE